LNATDLASWKLTAILLGALSIIMFTLQRTSYTVFEVGFEICIFHVPAILAVGVYLYLRRKGVTAPVVEVVPA
jgi:uncharacterized membrane protein YgdD (TMEM256/DUF423 family)